MRGYFITLHVFLYPIEICDYRLRKWLKIDAFSFYIRFEKNNIKAPSKVIQNNFWWFQWIAARKIGNVSKVCHRHFTWWRIISEVFIVYDLHKDTKWQWQSFPHARHSVKHADIRIDNCPPNPVERSIHPLIRSPSSSS